MLSWGILATAALAQIPVANTRPSPSAPVPAEIMPETVRSFNPLALQLAWNDRRWQIVHENDVLKDFGPHEQEARQALRMIQELGVNQYGTIGTPHPVMEYWLINGQAPQSLPRGGLVVQPLDPGRLEIQQTFGQWTLRDGVRAIFTFGNHEDDARQALAVIRKYGFTQIGTVGLGTPRMYLFFGRPTSAQPGVPNSPPGNMTAGHLRTPQFSRIAKNSDGTPRVEKPTTPTGFERVATGVVPPLTPPGPSRPSVGAPATTWHNPPHFGPRQPASVPGGGDRLTFDWRQVQIRLDGTEWKLTAGAAVLGTFGSNALDARVALSALRYYRFTEQRHAGDDSSRVPYFLGNSQSPRNVMLGVFAEPFRPDHVEVRQADDGYAVVDGQRVLMRFGSRQAEAVNLVKLIKREKYDQLCKLGPLGSESMTFLVRTK
jgi:hypothetical protein